MKPFTDKRRILWLAGAVIFVLGVLAAFVILPAATPTPGTDGNNVRVPSMQNVPPEQTPNMQLEIEDKDSQENEKR